MNVPPLCSNFVDQAPDVIGAASDLAGSASDLAGTAQASVGESLGSIGNLFGSIMDSVTFAKDQVNILPRDANPPRYHTVVRVTVGYSTAAQQQYLQHLGTYSWY